MELCFWRIRPQWARAFSFTRLLDHTQRHTTFGKTPMDEWSARRKELYLTTYNIYIRHPCPGGIRTHNLRKRAAADLRRRPRGHWDRHVILLLENTIHVTLYRPFRWRRISFMKRQFEVTNTIRQIQIPALLENWIINTPSVKMVCLQKKEVFRNAWFQTSAEK